MTKPICSQTPEQREKADAPGNSIDRTIDGLIGSVVRAEQRAAENKQQEH